MIIGCSAPPLKPVPEDLRHTVRILPLNDLTGSYKSLPVPFESLATSALSANFVEVIEPIGTGPELRIYPNVFRPIGPSATNDAAFTVRGEVERIVYEPANQIKKMIVGYVLSGLLFTGSEKDMGAFVQYRFCVNDKEDVAVDSFVTVGASSGERDKTSRQQLMAEANKVAACNFASDLLFHLSRKYQWDIPSRRENPPIQRKLCTKDIL